MVEKILSPEKQHVFCSYSSADRNRVNGLGLLLQALGHEVFIDHKTIKPGMRWEARLQDGLDQANVLLVYWTKYAARSDWVRKEIEYFHVHFPDRMLVPVLGDETPLTELLSPYQHSDFCPLINELLDMKRSMQQQGIKSPQIQDAILKRLSEAGIQIEERNKNKFFQMFAALGLTGLLTAPAAFLYSMGNRSVEAVAQLTGAQAAILGVAAVTGAAVCGLSDLTSESARELLNESAENSAYSNTIENTGSTISKTFTDKHSADRWLGKWLGSKYNGDREDQNFWFKVERVCDEYRIGTNTSVPGEVKILEISETQLRFLDKAGTDVVISTLDGDISSGTANHPDQIVKLGIPPQTQVEYRKINIFKAKSCSS